MRTRNNVFSQVDGKLHNLFECLNYNPRLLPICGGVWDALVLTWLLQRSSNSQNCVECGRIGNWIPLDYTEMRTRCGNGPSYTGIIDSLRFRGLVQRRQEPGPVPWHLRKHREQRYEIRVHMLNLWRALNKAPTEQLEF